jgi:hypothetical protein
MSHLFMLSLPLRFFSSFHIGGVAGTQGTVDFLFVFGENGIGKEAEVSYHLLLLVSVEWSWCYGNPRSLLGVEDAFVGGPRDRRVGM